MADTPIHVEILEQADTTFTCAYYPCQVLAGQMEFPY